MQRFASAFPATLKLIVPNVQADRRQHQRIFVAGESMRKPTKRAASYLFTVRLWHEDLGNGEREWRGEVRDVVSSQQHYFRDWDALVDFIQTSCRSVEQDGGIQVEHG